jgi:hypothetical protein
MHNCTCASGNTVSMRALSPDIAALAKLDIGIGGTIQE